MSEELKACPFCGGEAEIDYRQSFRHFRTGEPLEQVAVYCRDCSANVSNYPGDLGLSRDETAEHCIQEWNTRATDAENQRLRAEVDALREDCRKLLENEPVATCESCGTWLLDGDDYVTDPDGVAGCWASMTDVPSKTERQCYAYRVGKCDARAALKEQPRADA